MASLLSNVLNSFAVGMHKTKYKHEQEEKNVELVELNTNI